MPRFHLTFHSRVEGRFNAARRYVKLTPGAEKHTVLVDVCHPDELWEKIIKEGNKFHQQVGTQITVSAGWLSNVDDPNETRRYHDAIGAGEWKWIKHWIREEVEA